jgi:hypothetical protein
VSDLAHRELCGLVSYYCLAHIAQLISLSLVRNLIANGIYLYIHRK